MSNYLPRSAENCSDFDVAGQVALLFFAAIECIDSDG
jgi:hypothetical protein